MIQLTFFTDSGSTFTAAARALIESFCGVRLVSVPERDQAQLIQDADASPAPILRIPRIGAFTRMTIPPPEDPGADDAAHDPLAPFPFDLFAALRFWLADEAHHDAPDAAFDVHDRLRGAASAQEALGLRRVPIVNAYLLRLRRWLELRLGQALPPPLPDGKRCRIVLTHDVDDPIDPGAVAERARLVVESARRGQGALTLRLAAALGRSAWARLQHPGDRHWLFDAIMQEEERRGFTSTFFFASRPCFAPHAHRLDVAYDLRSPAFRAAMARLRERGFEIGLHCSYNARDEVSLLREELDALRQAAGVEIAGSRHHFWHMRRPFWPTLEDHGRVGLTWDCSVGFNEATGLRLAVAHPIHLWNPQTGQLLSTLQIPSALMDGALLYAPNTTLRAAQEEVQRVLDALKRSWGTAAMDWHVRTSWPGSARFERWGRLYLEVLDMLAADPEIEVIQGLALARQRR